MSHRPQIIGLTGHMGTGKDATAALLSMLGYARVAFADQVRAEVAAAIRNRDKMGASVPNFVRRDLAAASIHEVWAKPTSERMRRILQSWGSEYRRTEDPDYWVRSATAGISGPTVFSDVRFPNEVAAIRGKGGVIWKIERPVVLNGIPGHVSETAIADIVPDRVIDNTGTMLDLARIVRGQLADSLA